uniref:Uncharacterized protein n=1 Tax=Arundo donax TaxID=35708 RepID=A0A0A8Z1B9_ARUDO
MNLHIACATSNFPVSFSNKATNLSTIVMIVSFSSGM